MKQVAMQWMVASAAVLGLGLNDSQAQPSITSPSAPVEVAQPTVTSPTATTPSIPPVATLPSDLQQACVAAMNADPVFEKSVLRVLDDKKFAELEKAQQKFAGIQIEAGARVAKNERHVILAYAAIWLAAAGFVLFLWQRQRGLRGQIESLRNDLAAALRGSK